MEFHVIKSVFYSLEFRIHWAHNLCVFVYLSHQECILKSCEFMAICVGENFMEFNKNSKQNVEFISSWLVWGDDFL